MLAMFVIDMERSMIIIVAMEMKNHFDMSSQLANDQSSSLHPPARKAANKRSKTLWTYKAKHVSLNGKLHLVSG